MAGWTRVRAAGGWVELALVLGMALLLAWFASATPAAQPADAPADRLSAGRAMADIRLLAPVPHPVGTPQDAHVRDLLVGRLQALGLQPVVTRKAGITAWGERSTQTWTVDDVTARVAGSDPAAPALLVMSHYDSRIGSPGAADDMAGVAVALEMARLLRLHPPARDVVFALTDGEEAGLLGAQALLSDPAFVRSMGFVVNMDVRGGGGRALMFQTAPNEAGAERMYASHADRPSSNSFAAYLYEKMPNDTDFSVSMAHGLPGLNYAFIGRPNLYHTPAAVPAAVETGAVQSLGDQAWAVVAPLAYSASLPKSGPDLTWFDVFGRFVIAYPPAFGWAVVGAAALLLGAAAWGRRSGLRVRDVALGMTRSLAATVVAAVLLWLFGRLAVHGYYQALGQAPLTETAVGTAALLASLAAFRIGAPPPSPLGRWLGAVLVTWLIALGLQVAAPRTAFVAEAPALLAALALAVCSLWRSPGARLCAAVCAVLATALLLEFWHLLVLGVGLAMPVIGAALLPLVLGPLAPFVGVEAPRAGSLRRR